MKEIALITAVLLATTNFVWASGGLSIDKVEQHMNAQNWKTTNTERQKILVQGLTDKFEVELPNQGTFYVDTDQFKHNYDGHV